MLFRSVRTEEPARKSHQGLTDQNQYDSGDQVPLLEFRHLLRHLRALGIPAHAVLQLLVFLPEPALGGTDG